MQLPSHLQRAIRKIGRRSTLRFLPALPCQKMPKAHQKGGFQPEDLLGPEDSPFLEHSFLFGAALSDMRRRPFVTPDSPGLRFGRDGLLPAQKVFNPLQTTKIPLPDLPVFLAQSADRPPWLPRLWPCLLPWRLGPWP